MPYTVYATPRDLQRHFTFSSLQRLTQIETPGQTVNDVSIPTDPEEGASFQLFANLADDTKQELLEELIKSACTKINRALRPRYGASYKIPFEFTEGSEDDTTETLKRWAVAFAAQELMNKPGSKLEQGQRTFLMMHYDECKKELDRVAGSQDDLDMTNATTVSSTSDPVVENGGTNYGSAFGEDLRTINSGVIV